MKSFFQIILIVLIVMTSGCVRQPSDYSKNAVRTHPSRTVPSQRGVARTPGATRTPGTTKSTGTTRTPESVGQGKAEPVTPNNPTPKPQPESTLSGAEIFEKCDPAVFMIYTTDGMASFQGSGFFVSSNGIALSNYHVFRNTNIGLSCIKLSDGRKYRVKVLYEDSINDVIIISVDAPSGTAFNYIPLSKRTPKVGEKVHAIGSPKGFENTYASGEISGLRENHQIQINVPIDHGSSGGALLNEYGEVIGITSSGIEDTIANINFAVSIDVVKKPLAKYLNQ